MTNAAQHPFIYGRPVRPDEFFNREASLRTVFNRLRHSESTAVVGEPHIGKSSLLLKLADPTTQGGYLGDDAERVIVGEIDLHPISNAYTPAAFWQEALDVFEEVDADETLRGRLNRATASGYQRRALERVFLHLGRQGRKLVLLLDEFDRLLHHPNFREPTFFAQLRSLATRTGGLAVIPASRLSVAQMNEMSRGLLETGSPFFNNIIEEKLAPFDEATLGDLLRQARDRLSRADRGLVRQIAGQNPFLVQAMAAALAEEPAGPQRTPRAVARFYERISFHFDDLWHTLDDRTRSTAVVLSLLGLGGRTLGADFAADEFDQLDLFGSELQRLASLGLARPVATAAELVDVAWHAPVRWRGEQWTIAAQSFAWWVREVVITGTRIVPSFDDWLANERYRALLAPAQWAWLLGRVRPPAQATPTPESLRREQLLALRDVLVNYFSADDLQDLSFDLGFDYEDIPGTTKRAKARGLTEYAERRGRGRDLLAAAYRRRPHLGGGAG